MKYGLDVSHWNGNINFQRLDADFVIMKVSQGTHKDVKFDEYYNSCQLPKGAYIYNKVLTLASAKEEAEYAVKCLQGKKLDYGVWLDMEDASMRILSKKLLTDIILTEATILRGAGFNVGIYCNRDWYLNVLDSATLCDSFPFWIARYPSMDNGTPVEKLSPKALKGCKLWQYSSKGTKAGIMGYVDLNVEYEPPFTDINPVQTVDDLARAVLAGVYGSGDRRRQLLGNRYAEVQKRVNELLNDK